MKVVLVTSSIVLYTLLLLQNAGVFGFSPTPPLVRSPWLEKAIQPFLLASPPLTPAILIDDFGDPSVASDDKLSKRWRGFVPEMWESPRGIDLTVSWTATDGDTTERCQEAAHKWWKLAQLHECKLPDHGEKFVVNDLARFMETFANFCNLHLNKPKSFKARVVATRGSVSTKCPQWHLDHVSVRWIQALVGRGVEWLDPEAVQWSNMNALHEADDEPYVASVKQQNSMLVNQELMPQCRHQAPTGQAALLLGNKWTSAAKDGISTPCVHKSPDGFAPWEGRVMLIMDVELEEDETHNS